MTTTRKTEYDSLKRNAASLLSGSDHAAAEESLRRLLSYCRSTFGKDDRRTCNAEVSLGQFLTSHGRARGAVEMLQHAVAARGKPRSAPEAAENAESLFALGMALDKSGEDTEAMDYYAFAYNAYLSCAGPTHPRTIEAALNVGETARIARDFESAERWFRVVLAAHGAEDRHLAGLTAHALNNLAEALLEFGRADEAAPLAEQGLVIRKRRFGERSSEYVRSLSVVGRIAAKRGDRARLDQVMNELRAASDSDRVQMSIDLGLAYLEDRGDYEQAVKVCERALATLDSPDQAADDSLVPNQRISLRFTLGRLLTHLKRWSDATTRLKEAFELETLILSDEAPHRSQRQMRLLLRESRERIAILLDVLSRAPDVAPADVREAYEIIQRRKSLETRLLTLQRPSFITDPALTAAPPDRVAEIRELLVDAVDTLRGAREQWLAALLSHVRQPESEKERLAMIARQDVVERVERYIASFVGQASYDWAVIGPTARTPKMPKGEAIIEYFFAQTPSPQYHAFVVVGDDVHLKSLGDGTQIDQAVAQLRARLIEERPQHGDSNPPWRRRARYLANALLKPLLPWLGQVTKLYVVPDADLFTLPFDLLPLDDGSLAIDRWTITHLWNGGERGGFNITLGSPDDPGRPVVVSPTTSTVEGTAVARRFEPLPFAEREGEAIAGKIGADHLPGARATKAGVIASERPEALHFAAHSFWIPRRTGSVSLDETEPPLIQARSVIDDPMYRSGIALSGADAELSEPTPASPGILFASDVLDLDLRDTDLVVLSSCQSGLGDPQPGDGIQGLRRAFRAAGASTVVSSLWRVPDEPTRDLMVDFYDRVLAKVPRGEALHQAKDLIRKRFPDDPFYWAGFVLDGFDTPLFRFSGIRGLKVATISGVGLSLDAAREHIDNEEYDKALRSLDFVIGSQTADDALRAEAKLERADVFRRMDRLDDAIEAYNALIDDTRAPAETMRQAVAERGLTRHRLGDLPGAYADYTSALSSGTITAAARAPILVNRGYLSATMDDANAAIADWSEVLSMPEAPPDQRRMALLNRADLYRRTDRVTEAIDDATALAESPDSKGTPQREQAYLVLAMCALEQNDMPAATAAVRRHLEERVSPAPPAAAVALSAATTPERLMQLIAQL